MRVLLSICLLLSFGCGSGFDLKRRGIYLDVPQSLPSRHYVLTALIRAVTQLGSGVSPIPTGQTVTVRESDCQAGQAGDVNWQAPSTIRLCEETLQGVDAALDEKSRIFAVAVLTWATKHELGHVLGFRDHLPCETGATMVPRWSCYEPVANGFPYSDEDVAAICESGRCWPLDF